MEDLNSWKWRQLLSKHEEELKEKKNKVGRRGRRGVVITEQDVLHARENTGTPAEAARFLKVSFDVFKKWALQYYDASTGLSHYEAHKLYGGTGRKKRTWSKVQVPLENILEGKYKYACPSRLVKRLLKEKVVKRECAICGFHEGRMNDHKIPLLLDYIDGNQNNLNPSNLRMLCYNHYFLYVDELKIRKVKAKHLNGY